jgi:hypothetical protein
LGRWAMARGYRPGAGVRKRGVELRRRGGGGDGDEARYGGGGLLVI